MEIFPFIVKTPDSGYKTPKLYHGFADPIIQTG